MLISSGIKQLERNAAMITIECPFCDEPIRMDGQADAVRCETCRVELEFANEDALPVIAEAA